MPRNGTALPRQRTVLLVGAGCLGTIGRSVEGSETVAQQVESRHDALSGYRATVDRTVSTDASSTTTLATVEVENPDYRRGEDASHVRHAGRPGNGRTPSRHPSPTSDAHGPREL
jgi:hypothetical protein